VTQHFELKQTQLARSAPGAAALEAAPPIGVAAPARAGAAEAPGVIARTYGARDRAVRRLLAEADALAMAAALVLAFIGAERMWAHVLWGLLAVPVWLVICSAYGLYGKDIKRISHSAVEDLPGLAHALLLTCLLLWLYFHVVPTGKLHFKHILMFAALALVLALALRVAARAAIRRRLGPERVLLVGNDAAIAVVAGKLAGHPEYGAEIAGLVADGERAPADGEPDLLAEVPRLGGLDPADVRAAVADHAIDRIVVSHGDMSTEQVLALVRAAQEAGVKVAVVPQPFDAMGPSVEVDNVEGLTVFGMYPPVLARSSRAIKRAMDVAGSLVLLALLAPVAAAIAVAIKLDTRGPVLFRQQRIGRGGRPFQLLKFRTMVTGADRMVDELFADSGDPDWLLLERDPRITRVGAFLRRSSLDELPQAWNVLKGQMSLVGPRPLVAHEDDRIRGWGRVRIDLTPGMTGLWQVLGRTSIPFRDMITLDYLYVTNWSFWGDVKLLMSTVPVLLSRRGAN
jgi:exopolysaccharide biosynthesis polyprenyl glycosylphosphotransferase